MKSLVFFLALAMAAPAAQSQLYKWVDEDGNVTYQDQPPPDEVSTASMLKLPPLGRAGKRQKPPVVLYRTQDCAPCDYAEQFLKRKNVAVRSVDVSSDVQNQAELKEKAGNLSVPTLVLAGKVIKGFTPSWLASELDAAGYTKPQRPEGLEEEYDSATDPDYRPDDEGRYPPDHPFSHRR